MGLIKAGIGALGGTLADQWKEYFYCDSLDKEVLVVKGQKKVSSRSSNTKASDNIISNGSVIAVNEGQCMMIVEQGKIVDVCAETGEYVFDKSTEPSIFSGSLGKSIVETFKTIGKRFTYGGDTGKDQRVYYFNIKELMDNKFGTKNPIPFRVVDSKIGLDIDLSLRCNGVYSYKISNPLLFYTNVCANVTNEYRREEIDGQLKTEFISALMPAIGRMSELELRPSQLMSHTNELCNYLNEELTKDWQEKRGLSIVSVALGPVTLTEEDQELLKNAQRTGMLRDPGMAGATLVGAQADAMKSAASNSAGAMTGFMGMGMAMNTAGGTNAQSFYSMNNQNPQNNRNASQAQTAPTAPKAQTDSWTCSCGTVATGKFCPECGSPKPAETGWTCTCGSVNKGKFCPNCGAKKPADAPLYRCDKCGWEPEDPKNPPKFCPNCGDKFDDSDIR